MREERRKLKQQLFKIRLAIESNSDSSLSEELKELRTIFENLKEFRLTSWSEFPEGWDIGDPNKVKETGELGNGWSPNDIKNKPYFSINFTSSKTESLRKLGLI